MGSILSYDLSTVVFSVFESLFYAGNHPEDGTALDGSSFTVVATFPDGTRFGRYIGGAGWDFEIIDGDYPAVWFDQERKDLLQHHANQLADKLNDIVKSGGTPWLNPNIWEKMDPAYGSAAYLSHVAEHEMDEKWLANN